MIRGMNRRGVAAAVLGVLALVTLGLAWGGPASGTPEPIDSFTTLDVNPSDNLPTSSLVRVDGVGFGSEGTVPTSATVRQCVPSIGGCGAPTSYAIVAGNFTGSFVAVRMLTLSDTTFDCSKDTCELQASDGFNSAAHHLT